MAFPPKLIKPYVTSFCRSIVKDPRLRYISVDALPDVPPDSCFETVPQHVARFGGACLVGWSVWEWPTVLIEAEFHCIWVGPDSREVDITPKQIPATRILFFEDPHRRYEGFQRDNVRKALRRDRDIDRFIELSKAMYGEMNAGELKFQHGLIPASESYLRAQSEKARIQMRMTSRYGEHLLAARNEAVRG